MNVLINPIFGLIKIVPTERWEGDILILGGYSITYDQNGKEVSRTADTENCRCEFPDEESKKLWRQYALV